MDGFTDDTPMIHFASLFVLFLNLHECKNQWINAE